MANEINYKYSDTGSFLYFTIETLAGTIWNGAAFVTMAVADWATYSMTLTETPVGGYRYIGSMTGVPAGVYYIRVYLRSGVTASITDSKLASKTIKWDGTSEINVKTIKDILIIASGTINDAAPSKTKFITTLTGYGLDYWDNMAIRWTSGPNSGLIRALKSYKNDGEFTMNTALPNTPTNGDAFDVIMLRAFRLSGLSQQEIADALQLAPTGVAADGSVGEQLAQIVGFLEGEGNRSVTIQLYITATTTPIADATITVMNSLDNLFLTQKTTDSNGQIVMARNDGTYKLRISKSGYTFTTPETLTVSGSATHTFYGTGISIPVPAAGLQTLYGNIRRLNWALPAGEKVYATIIGQQHPNSALVQDYKLEATIDAAGQFTLTVPQAATIRFEADRYGFHEITTTTDATKDIVDYL